MPRLQYSSTRLSKLGLMAAVLAAGFAMTGSARASGNETETPTEVVVVTRTASTGGLNLLTAPRQGAPVVRVRQMGSGSWICSPAGFGQNSRCYRN